MANSSCSSKDYDFPFIPEDLIVFHFIINGVIILNISNATVISPFIYEFELPEEYSNCTEDTFMRMTFRGENMFNRDVPFCSKMHSGRLELVLYYKIQWYFSCDIIPWLEVKRNQLFHF